MAYSQHLLRLTLPSLQLLPLIAWAPFAAEKPLFAFFKEKASRNLFTITSYSWPHCFLSNSTAISQVWQSQLHPGNLGLSRGSFTPSGVHLFIPSMPEKPAGEINLQGGKTPNLWHSWAIKLRGMRKPLSTGDDTYRYVCLNKRLVGFSLTW